jgi:hypothetical protein
VAAAAQVELPAAAAGGAAPRKAACGCSGAQVASRAHLLTKCPASAGSH